MKPLVRTIKNVEQHFEWCRDKLSTFIPKITSFEFWPRHQFS
jgi:hypothetical protein